MSSDEIFNLMDEWGPEKILCVSHRRSGMKGVLVLDNTARGIGKGGTRMSPSLTVGEVARLARTMTWKWAAVDLFFGGAKAGILGDPEAPNKEEMLRAFARVLANEVPAEYVFGLDMGLAEQDAAIFVDELNCRGVATGLPRALGGVPYDELGVTGFGVAEAAAAAVLHEGGSLSGLRVVVQGFGAVGAAATDRLHDLGATIIAVSNAHGTLMDPKGVDVKHLLALRALHGDAGLARAGILQPVDAALTLDCDLLVPAASQDTIGIDIAAATGARWVVEGANLPTSAQALHVLHQRGVTVVPDFIANAGGIIAAAYSMDASTSAFAVEPQRVFSHMTEILRANTVKVLERSAEAACQPHDAARSLAKGRVKAAMKLRGQWRDADGGPKQVESVSA